MQRTSARGQAAAVVVVLLALVAPVTAVAVAPPAAPAAQQPRPVDSCGVIDESGVYTLTGNVTGNAADACIRVAASDVVLDGNGHTVAGQNASGDGVLVFRGEDDSSTPERTLENVTVRNLTAANWSNGLAVGTLDGGGTDVRLSDVTARENRYAGLRLSNAENVTARNVTATGNSDGVTLWEVQDSTLRGVTATDNGEHGVAVLQVARENTIRNLRATGNGGGDADRGAGVYFSTDTGDNVVTGARIADNDGAGVRFADSFANTVRDSVVVGNDDAGVFGVPAYGDALRNVTVRGNGGPAVAHEPSESRSEFVADGLHLGDAASLSFSADPVNVERTDAATLPEPPRPLATQDGVLLSGVDTEVTAALSVDDPANSSLWRYDSSGWQRVADQRAAAGTRTGTVTGDGTVVALDASSQQDDEDSGVEDGDDETVGDGTLVVQATTSDDFGYLFVVDGDAEGVETDDVAADSGDSVVDSGDGTVTVVGSTGSNAGDAFDVDGEIVEFYTPASADDYVLELDGEDVTDEIPAPSEDE